MFGYSVNNDIAIISVFCFDGCKIYFEISDFNNLHHIYKGIEGTIRKHNEILLSSDSEALFQNSEFIKLFGKHDTQKSEQYGMFNIDKNNKIDKRIRKLTIEDEKLVLSFSEPIMKYHDNLRNTYETRIKTLDRKYLIYGYIDKHLGILGYLIANTLDGQYWDIAYIYVAENARGQGIAKKLAIFYANDISSKGYFASYGTPENEISKHVAVSAGFDMFLREYLTQWIVTI